MTVLLVSCAGMFAARKSPPAVLANINTFQMSIATVNMNRFLATDIDIKDIQLFLDPRKDIVELRFPFQGAKFIWCLTREGRDSLRTAIAAYDADFAAKKLERDTGKKMQYGILKLPIIWGTFTYNAQATAALQLGYKFIDKAPYFSIVLPETTNEMFDKTGGASSRSSGYVAIFCTRAQAAALSDMLAQDYLLAKLAEQKVPDNLLPEGQSALNAPDQY